MAQERFLEKVKENARANNRDLNHPDRNTAHFNWLASEAEVKRLYPGIDDGNTPGPGPSVNRAETVTQADLMRRMAKIRAEIAAERARLAMERQSEKKGPITIRVSFAKQHGPRFSFDDLVLEYLRERGLIDNFENREAARTFFLNIANRRGMLQMEPAFLRMSDAAYARYLYGYRGAVERRYRHEHGICRQT